MHMCAHTHTHTAQHLSKILLAYYSYSGTRALNIGNFIFTVIIIILVYLFNSLQKIIVFSLPNLYSLDQW